MCNSIRYAIIKNYICIIPENLGLRLSSQGRGVTCHDFWYGRAARVPGLHSIHILGEGKKKVSIRILP